jgi:hypothetical protein
MFHACCDLCHGNLGRSLVNEFDDAAWEKDWLVTSTHSLR